MNTHVVRFEPELDESFVEPMEICVGRNFDLVWGDGEKPSAVPIFAGSESACKTFLADMTAAMDLK